MAQRMALFAVACCFVSLPCVAIHIEVHGRNPADKRKPNHIDIPEKTQLPEHFQPKKRPQPPQNVYRTQDNLPNERRADQHLPINNRMEQDGGFGGVAPINEFTALAGSLTHSMELVREDSRFKMVNFERRHMMNYVQAWTDRNFYYEEIPEEVEGATLYAGVHKDMPKGNLTFVANESGTLLAWADVSKNRSGGFIDPKGKAPQGWNRIGQLKYKNTQGPLKGKCELYKFDKILQANTPVVISIRWEPWVGGVAFMPDRAPPLVPAHDDAGKDTGRPEVKRKGKYLNDGWVRGH